MDKIRSGIFPPGTALPSERLLAGQLKVSRSSLREAIRVLEHGGVVDVRSGSGTFITEEGLSKATLIRTEAAIRGEHSPLDLMAARLAVEPVCAELAATARRTDDLQAMEASLNAHESLLLSGGDAAAADRDFHIAVAAATHNDVLGDIEQYFVELMHQATWSDLKYRSVNRNDAGRQFLAEHRLIYEAITGGDQQTARAAMHSHLIAVQDALHGEIPAQDY